LRNANPSQVPTGGVVGSPAMANSDQQANAGHSFEEWTNRRWTSSFIALDPIEQFRPAMRIQRSLEEEDDILHWYHFILIAVPKDATPKAVVRWQGIEFSRHERIGENRFRLHGHNLSFARDLQRGALMCRRWRSPRTPVWCDRPLAPSHSTVPRHRRVRTTACCAERGIW